MTQWAVLSVLHVVGIVEVKAHKEAYVNPVVVSYVMYANVFIEFWPCADVGLGKGCIQLVVIQNSQNRHCVKEEVSSWLSF